VPVAWEEASKNLLLQKEALQVFGAVFLLVFSCKPSLAFNGQHKLLIDHQ